jgi:hypothetical protein
MAATELKEYNVGDGFKQNKPEINGLDDEEVEDHGPFAIDTEVPPLDANDHKPEVEDTPPHSPFIRYFSNSGKQNNSKNDTQEVEYEPTPPPITNENASTPPVSSPDTPNGSPRTTSAAKQGIRGSSQLSSSGGASPENERMVLSYNES